MSFAERLLTGIAVYLQSQGIGDYSPDSPPPDTGKPLIVLDRAPLDRDKTIALKHYPVENDPKLSDAVIGLNLRLRGDTQPTTVMGMDEAIYLVLHGIEHLAVGAPGAQVHLNHVWYRSGAALDLDTNGRCQWSVNYYVRVNQPHPRLE